VTQKRWVNDLQDVINFTPDPKRLFLSSTHEEILQGYTTDIYFISAQQILRHLHLDQTPVVAEIFARHSGIFCGLPEVLSLLSHSKVEMWSLPEGESFETREVVLRIKGPYSEFGIFETPLLGILAHSCGWATAARECKEAAGEKVVLCFGARHVHPSVAPVMERSALIGGVDSAACILGAKLAGKKPGGTIPHAAILICGDTVLSAKAFDECIPNEFPRIILVDTFKDEAEESLRLAKIMDKKLEGIRLDTPEERGGVTLPLVKEVRERLNQAGYPGIKIIVSGGITSEKIRLLHDYVDIFGVGSYISGRSPIDMTMDIKEVAGQKVAKRGRIPGITNNPNLRKIL